MLNEISVDLNKIISISDYIRESRKYNEKIEKDGIGYLFKDNKLSKVILSVDEYKKLLERNI